MATLEDLRARLRRLEDIEAIRNLRMRYHYLVNERMFERIHELYLSDAALDFGDYGRAEGEAAIRDFFLSIPRSMQFVKQFIHNHLVEVDGDAATGVSYLDARYAKDGESVMLAGAFHERYRRTGDGWRIAETKVTIYFAAPITKGWADAR